MELALRILGTLCAFETLALVAVVWVCVTRMHRPAVNASAVTTGQLNKTAAAAPPKPAFYAGPQGIRRPSA